ncbi:MAG: PIN domain-containing protein [Thermoleophilaceae bacterium]
MILYLDASALVKRFVAEPGSDLVRNAMQEAEAWFMCRVGYVETVRAVGLAAGPSAARRVRNEWGSMGVIELDHRLADEAADLALAHDLRSLDALPLAAASLLPPDDLVVATWDRRLHAAALAVGRRALPDAPSSVLPA